MGLLDEIMSERGPRGKRDERERPGLLPQGGKGLLDRLATLSAPIPVVGDVAGLAADAHRYATEPESRTLGNFGLSALGALPFIPNMTVWHGSPHRFDKFDLNVKR